MLRKILLALSAFFLLYTSALAQGCPPINDIIYCGAEGVTELSYRTQRNAQCESNAYNTNTCSDTQLVVEGNILKCNVHMESQSIYGGPPTLFDFTQNVVCITGYAPDLQSGKCKSTADCTPVACPATETRELEYYLCNVRATLTGNVAALDCDQPTSLIAQGSAVCMDGCWAPATTAVGHFEPIPNRNDWKQAWMTTGGLLTGAECTDAPPVPWDPPTGSPEEPGDPDPETGEAVDSALPEIPGFYTPKYPGGLGPLLADKLEDLKTSNIGSLLSWLLPTGIQDGGNPTWSITVMDHSYTVALGPTTWNFLRLCLLITALLVSRRLVFGG